MNKFGVFLLRAGLGLLGGWLLWHFFFSQGTYKTPWWTALVLAAIVVLAAYASEAWRRRSSGRS
jgi:membrane protein implicated in regulation of membrane protease activity